MNDTYHHGGLREAILTAAAETIIADGGPNRLSLRALAREVGVTHTAPRHHFGDKRGVLTALAAQGYHQMAASLEAAAATGSFADVGLAYVRFARDHPAHFQVMFQPDLTDPADSDLLAARQRLSDVLISGVRQLQHSGVTPDVDAATLAGWSLVHGMATLVLSGNLEPSTAPNVLAGEDFDDVSRRAIGLLFGTRPIPTTATPTTPTAQADDAPG